MELEQYHHVYSRSYTESCSLFQNSNDGPASFRSARVSTSRPINFGNRTSNRRWSSGSDFSMARSIWPKDIFCICSSVPQGIVKTMETYCTEYYNRALSAGEVMQLYNIGR